MIDRPESIANFERLFLGSMALTLIYTIGTWNDTPIPFATWIAVVAVIIVLGLNLLLILLVSRRRSRIAKWVLTVFYLLSAPTAVWAWISEPGTGWPLMDAVLLAMQGWGLALTFTPSARAWLKEKVGGPPSLETLERTFE
jgi:hypothetical protein